MALIETLPVREVLRIAAAPFHKFIVGVDLGQSHDPTALCVLHHHRDPLRQWNMTTNTPELVVHKQEAVEFYDVRHLERLPLGLSYPAVVEHVALILARPPLNNGAGAELVIDETGVGRAVGDIFEDAGMRPQRVTITAGNEATAGHGRNRHHVAKGILISTLDARLHTGELRFAAELTEAGAMAEELKDFRRKVSTAGRYSYDARTGKHDDLVLAAALALWWAVRPGPPVMTVLNYGI